MSRDARRGRDCGDFRGVHVPADFPPYTCSQARGGSPATLRDFFYKIQTIMAFFSLLSSHSKPIFHVRLHCPWPLSSPSPICPPTCTHSPTHPPTHAPTHPPTHGHPPTHPWPPMHMQFPLHFIPSHSITLHCIPSHCITSHPITLHPITSHCILSHLIASHRIPSHPNPSNRIAFHRITSHGNAILVVAIGNRPIDFFDLLLSIAYRPAHR